MPEHMCTLERPSGWASEKGWVGAGWRTRGKHRVLALTSGVPGVLQHLLQS